MRRMFIYFFGIMIPVFSMLVLLGACQNQPEDIAALTAELNPEVELAEDVAILYSDSARVRVRIAGTKMLSHLSKVEPSQEFPDGVIVDFFDPLQNIASTLVGRYAIRYERKGLVIVQDSVVWQSLLGERLETEELIWDEKLKKVYSNKFAVIKRPDEIIYGHGFTSNQDFTDARINAVEGIIAVEDPEKSSQ